MAQKPRCSFGAISDRYVCDDGSSPPWARPWIRRATRSVSDAQTPTAANVGAMPIIRLPTDASPTARVMEAFRPIRSPIQPNRKPPKGRATKPTAKIASVDSTADAGSDLLKSWLAMNGVNVA